MADNIHKGHRSRVRKQFLEDGGFAPSTPPHKILEMLLFYSIPVADTNELAHRLINHFGSLSKVFDAPYEELIQVNGISEVSACLIKMILPIARAYNIDRSANVGKLKTPDEIGKFLADRFIGLTEEVVLLLSMDNAGRVLAVDTISEGEVDSVGINARRAAEVAVKRQGTNVVLAHNHPSGIALPSKNDLIVTQTLVNAFRHLNIRMLDHIIVVDGDFISLALSKEYAYLFQ